MDQTRPVEPDSDAARDDDPQQLPECEVRAQVKRILSSAEFDVPERLRRFLLYVVDETLAGRAQRIKGYSVAVEVFGRPENQETQNDPVVRIEAGRLRRALERYYLLVGSSDPVLIDIPKGGYVPRFVQREAHESGQARPASRGRRVLTQLLADRIRATLPAAFTLATIIAIAAAPQIGTQLPQSTPVLGAASPPGPSLIVRPFANLSGTPEGDFYVAGLGEELLLQLARFKELTVLGRETSSALPSGASAADVASQFGSRFVLEGSIRLAEGRLRVTSRVLDGETSAILWSGSYDVDARAGDLVEMQKAIAARVATAVAQPYGIIFSTPPAMPRNGMAQNLETYRCTFRFYRYRAELDASSHAQTRKCLEEVTQRYPNHATGWAMLSYLYLDEDRFGLNPRPGSPSAAERARDAADRAIRVDPENVRALQALMTVLFFTREPAEALRVGAQALALNPNDTELLGEFGSRVAQAGDWPRGAALLEEAMTRNPGHSGYYTGLLALAAYMQGENVRAGELIRRANLRQFPIYHLIAALIFARLGLEDETARSRNEFLRMRPTFFNDFDGELDRRNFNARDRAILLRGVIQAGFPVPARFAEGSQ
jgi:TolB-like protein